MTNNSRGRTAPPAPGPGGGLEPRARNRAPATGGQDPMTHDRPVGRRATQRWLFAAAGTAATAISAAPGLAYAAAGQPQAVPLLICSGVIAMASIIAGAAIRIHDNAERTRRLQIQHAGPTAITEAVARRLAAPHAAPP